MYVVLMYSVLTAGCNNIENSESLSFLSAMFTVHVEFQTGLDYSNKGHNKLYLGICLDRILKFEEPISRGLR